MLKSRPAVVIIGILWIALLIGAVVWGVERFRSDLGTRALDALSAADISGATVDVDGRDLIITGIDESDEPRVATLLEELDGVRSVTFGDPVSSAPTTAAGTETTAPSAEADSSDDAVQSTTTTTAAPQTTTTTTAAPEPNVASITATLESGTFTLSGVVPDEATAQALLQAANLSYAPFVVNNLTIDPEVEPAPWLQGAPLGIGLIPMISEGTIAVSGDQITLSGITPSPEDVGRFEQAVGATFGLSNITSDIEVTNLQQSRFNVTRTDGVVVLTGELPSEEIKQIIFGGAVAAYGEAAVDDQTTVVDDRTTSFWMYTMPGVFQLFSPFQNYEINVEFGVTSGNVSEGIQFAYGSSALSEQTMAVLDIGVALLARDRTLEMIVAGHTDSDGPSDFNQRLSEDRAQAVVDHFTSRGISPERLQGVGFGEEQPIASNATADGRARNRRAEFQFGPFIVTGG